MCIIHNTKITSQTPFRMFVYLKIEWIFCVECPSFVFGNICGSQSLSDDSAHRRATFQMYASVENNENNSVRHDAALFVCSIPRVTHTKKSAQNGEFFNLNIN